MGALEAPGARSLGDRHRGGALRLRPASLEPTQQRIGSNAERDAALTSLNRSKLDCDPSHVSPEELTPLVNGVVEQIVLESNGNEHVLTIWDELRGPHVTRYGHQKGLIGAANGFRRFNGLETFSLAAFGSLAMLAVWTRFS